MKAIGDRSARPRFAARLAAVLGVEPLVEIRVRPAELSYYRRSFRPTQRRGAPTRSDSLAQGTTGLMKMRCPGLEIESRPKFVWTALRRVPRMSGNTPSMLCGLTGQEKILKTTKGASQTSLRQHLQEQGSQKLVVDPYANLTAGVPTALRETCSRHRNALSVQKAAGNPARCLHTVAGMSHTRDSDGGDDVVRGGEGNDSLSILDTSFIPRRLLTATARTFRSKCFPRRLAGQVGRRVVYSRRYPYVYR